MSITAKTNKKEKKKRRGVKRAIEMIGAVTKKATTARQKRGFTAEEKALRAANYWRKKKIILKVRETKGLGWEDQAMIDLVITLLTGDEVLVQVKNFCNLAVVEECRKKGVLFYFIGQDEYEDVARTRMLTDVIFLAYYSLLKITPFQARQLFLNMLKMKQVTELSRWQSFKKIFSPFGKATY